MVNYVVKIYSCLKLGGIKFLLQKVKDKRKGTGKPQDFLYHKLQSAEPREYKELLSWIYGMRCGKKLDLDHPETFNEKIQWLKLYDSSPLKTMLADKWKVREWVSKKIGEQYLIPVLGVWDSFLDMDTRSLPEAFVLKATHGSGMNVIVRNKSCADWNEIKNKFDHWMPRNFAFAVGLELQYRNIPPKIIAEQYIQTENDNLYDYKIHCFGGKPLYIQVIGDRDIASHTAKEAFYDTDWQLQQFTYTFPQYKEKKKKPVHLKEMLYLAQKLSEGFSYVRVDLYELDNGELKFGEMTFTPASGMDCWTPETVDYLLGNLIHLPEGK